MRNLSDSNIGTHNNNQTLIMLEVNGDDDNSNNYDKN